MKAHWYGVVAMLAAAARLGPGNAWAQTDPRLVDAVRLAQEGNSDSARAEVSKLLSATAPTDTLYPEILYTQAMVAADAGQMRTLLQRVVVEHGASSWADEALLRLVQMDYATRNLEGAARNVERLRSDYPASPLLAQASYWAARVYFDQSKSVQACKWLVDGMAAVGGNIELQNQLAYLNQRCANVTVASADTGAAKSDTATARPDSSAVVTDTAAARPDTTTRPAADSTPVRSDSAAAPSGKTVYRVQIAAVGNKAAAAASERKARALGLTVKTLFENKLYKVRAGQYPTRAAAQAAAAGLKVKLGGNPFVVSEP
jgi:cell division septation protein DedD